MTGPHGDLALFTVAGVGPSTVPVPGERALFDVIADRITGLCAVMGCDRDGCDGECLLDDVPGANPLASTDERNGS